MTVENAPTKIQPNFAWRKRPIDSASASDKQINDAIEANEVLENAFTGVVIGGVFLEFVFAFLHPPADSFQGVWSPIIGDAFVAIGLVFEVIAGSRVKTLQSELTRRSNERLGDAIERATKADLARVELEAKLSPRMLSTEQWDIIQGLKGQFPVIAIAYEIDAETHWFASNIRDAFFSAGIAVAMYPRAANVHSFGTFIYEPNGFDGAKPKTVAPLVDIFGVTEYLGSLAIIRAVPTDIVAARENMPPDLRAPLDTPMILVGGRFVIPPPYLEKAAKAAKAMRDKIKKEADAARESTI